jgi:hypothetical protein
MSRQDDVQEKARQQSDAPVASLIRSYDERRKAWLEQASELARMREEVRSAADREAAAVITRARQKVRDIVADARRELMVLGTQVQAVLGEAEAIEQRADGRERGPMPQLAWSDATGAHLNAAIGAELDQASDDPLVAAFEDAKADLEGFITESDEALMQLTSGNSGATRTALGPDRT